MNDSAKTIESIDAVTRKTIEHLRQHIIENPEAVQAKLLLDGIVEQLVQQICQQEGEEGDYRLTVSLLEELTRLVPEYATPYQQMAKTFIAKGDYAAALEYIERGLQVQSDDWNLRFDYAYCLMYLGKTAKAIAEFHNSLKIEEDYPWAYCNMGNCYRDLRQYDKAEKYFMKAIEIDKTFLPAYQNLSVLYQDHGAWEKCAHYARIVVENLPRDKEARLTLGEAFMGMKEYRPALQHLVAATLIDPDFCEAYETMSAVFADLEMYELAIGAAGEALRINPHSWMALANCGCALGKHGRYREAIERSLEALEQRPPLESMYQIHCELGWWHFKAGEHTKALEHTDKALTLIDSPDVFLHFNKGLMCLVLGKEREARETYDQALEMVDVLRKHDVLLDAMKDVEDCITAARAEGEGQTKKMRLLEEIKTRMNKTLDGWFAFPGNPGLDD